MAAVKKENELYIFLVIGDILMVLAPEFHRFVWLCVEMFARLVSPVCNGGNLNRGSRIQRDELFNANKPF